MKRLAAVFAALGLAATGTATVSAQTPALSMTVADGAAQWAGTPVCSTGDAIDTTPDNVVVDPSAGAFLSAKLHQTGAVPGSDVRTRTTVHHHGKQRWYNLVIHGAGGARHLSTVEQALAFDLSAHPVPVTSMPAVGEPAPLSMTVALQAKGSDGKWATRAKCALDLVVWADGDTAIPAGAVRLADVPHPGEHPYVAVPNLSESFLVRKYPGGEHYPVACDGTSPEVVRSVEGSIRMEPGVAARSVHPDHPVMTSDVWVFQDFGDGLAFDWRQRSPDIPTAGQEFSQSGNPVAIRLPGGGDVDDYGPVRWRFNGHFHIEPASSDPNGLICSATVTIGSEPMSSPNPPLGATADDTHTDDGGTTPHPVHDDTATEPVVEPAPGDRTGDGVVDFADVADLSAARSGDAELAEIVANWSAR